MSLAYNGQIIQLLARGSRNSFIFALKAGDTLQTHQGVLKHDDLIGQPLGTEVVSHRGYAFLMLEPSTDDLIRDLKRNSQIMYPKDIGFILMKMAVRPGVRVVEAGTGSAGLTIVLAQAVGDNGQIYTYETREDMQNLARKNVARLGLTQRVTFKLRDIADGFDETEADALFLDVPNPWDYLGQARAALKGGGFFGSILPTTNQVSDLLIALHRAGFEFAEVCEVLIRYYKTVPARLRPEDRMVAHTGFLIFARPVTRATPPEQSPSEDEEATHA